MTLSGYAQLKEQTVLGVASCANYEQLLGSLKELFKKDINSARRYETINSIRDLLNVLEIRDVLSEHRVYALKLIVGRLSNNNDLMQKIIEYEENHVPREHMNEYAQALSKTLSQDQEEISRHSYISSGNQYMGAISSRKKRRIFDTITEQIGMFWRDLGRYLNVQEGVIDEIDINNAKQSEKVRKLLDYYETKKADPQRWFFHICKALESSRRRDLSRELQEIMTMNI